VETTAENRPTAGPTLPRNGGKVRMGRLSSSTASASSSLGGSHRRGASTGHIEGQAPHVRQRHMLQVESTVAPPTPWPSSWGVILARVTFRHTGVRLGRPDSAGLPGEVWAVLQEEGFTGCSRTSAGKSEYHASPPGRVTRRVKLKLARFFC